MVLGGGWGGEIDRIPTIGGIKLTPEQLTVLKDDGCIYHIQR